MKLFTITVCFLVITFSSAYGQSELNAVRDMLGPPPKPIRIISERMYRDTVRLKDLQLMSGTLIAQSKLPGTSAAITEKAVTINAGSRVFSGAWLGLGPARRVSVQGIVTGQSEEGLVSIFKDGTYQRTLGAGASVNLFFFGPLTDRSETFYRFDSLKRDSLHRQLREEMSIYLATKCPLPAALTNAATSLCTLLNANPTLFNQLRDDTAVLDSCSSVDTVGVKARLLRLQSRSQYQVYLNELKGLLPSKWEELPPSSAAVWVTTNLCSTATINALYQAKQYKNFVRHIDSLQLAKVVWKHRQLRWLSFKYLANTEQQPIYDPSAALLMTKQQFGFNDIRVSLNNAYIRRKIRYFFAQGIGYNSQRTFEPDKMLTYQKSTSQTLPSTATPVVTVEESKFYLQAPSSPDYLVLDGQGSFFLTKMRLGLDATVKYKWDSKAPDQTTATLGLFLPVLAAESSINFMLQQKWDTITKWTTGFNLSASIPGFLTSKK